MKDNAQSVASGCLPLSGGTMTGNIVATLGKGLVNIDYGSERGIYPDGPGVYIKSGYTSPTTLKLQSKWRDGILLAPDISTPTGAGDVRLGGIADPVNPGDAVNLDFFKASIWEPKSAVLSTDTTQVYPIKFKNKYTNFTIVPLMQAYKYLFGQTWKNLNYTINLGQTHQEINVSDSAFYKNNNSVTSISYSFTAYIDLEIINSRIYGTDTVYIKNTSGQFCSFLIFGIPN